MMWIWITAGWVLAAATLYTFLIATAKEPQHEECMDCRRAECTGCPYLAEQAEALKRAA